MRMAGLPRSGGRRTNGRAGSGGLADSAGGKIESAARRTFRLAPRPRAGSGSDAAAVRVDAQHQPETGGPALYGSADVAAAPAPVGHLREGDELGEFRALRVQ